MAAALGEIEANINLVEMVEESDSYEIDELILDLPPTVTVESLVRHATACRVSGWIGCGATRGMADRA